MAIVAGGSEATAARLSSTGAPSSEASLTESRSSDPTVDVIEGMREGCEIAISYEGGESSAFWGRYIPAALRASLGRSQPFTLKFVEIGNEVGYRTSNDTESVWLLNSARNRTSSRLTRKSCMVACARLAPAHFFCCTRYTYRYRDFFGNLSAAFPALSTSTSPVSERVASYPRQLSLLPAMLEAQY